MSSIRLRPIPKNAPTSWQVIYSAYDDKKKRNIDRSLGSIQVSDPYPTKEVLDNIESLPESNYLRLLLDARLKVHQKGADEARENADLARFSAIVDGMINAVERGESYDAGMIYEAMDRLAKRLKKEGHARKDYMKKEEIPTKKVKGQTDIFDDKQ